MIFILHGASCAGKTYIINRVRDNFDRLRVLEMGHKAYYNQFIANENLPEYKVKLSSLLKKIESSENKKKINAINDYLDRVSPERFLCVVDFIYKVVIQDKPSIASCPTCEKLPPPNVAPIWFYRYIADLFRVEINHILVTCESLQAYKKQLKNRGRHNNENTKKYIKEYLERQQNAHHYDYMIKGPEEFIGLLNKNGIRKIGVFNRTVSRIFRTFVQRPLFK